MANVVRPGDQAVQRLLDLLLGLGVHRAGRLVEDEDARVVQDRAGDAIRWRSPPERRLAALADHRVVAVGEADDEVVGVGGRARRDHLVAGRLGVAVADVVGDGAVEQVRLLEHDPDLPPEPSMS